MKRRIILIILALIFSFPAFSRPARTGLIAFRQPDGTTFTGEIRGDEFMRIATTSQGCAMIQDEDGWWNYAYYDEGGRKFSSGWRVGQDAPPEILSQSRRIPYGMLSENAAARRMAVREDEIPILARLLNSKAETRGEEKMVKHGLIILAQYKDVKFSHEKDDFVKLLTSPGYDLNGATGSAKEYFDAQFNGSIEFSFDVSDIVTLSGTMAQYGGNDSNDNDKAPARMIAEACSLADEGIDFSLYDDDGDGFVDNVFVFFAGGDEAEGAGSDCIWSHAWYIYKGAGIELTLDGKQIDRYACTSELSRRYTTMTDYRDVLAGIGTFCHEYFHTFGIPDMYDTDYEESGGYAAGLWTWTSLMDAGNMNNYGNTPPNLNAIEREYLGISAPVTITEDGGYSLDPIHRSGKYYRIDTDTENEYYLLECRASEGWDKHIGGQGMLVYHIDKSERSAGFSDSYGRSMSAWERWEYTNEINCRPDHQCADLVEADSRPDNYPESENVAFNQARSNIQGIFFPYGEVNSLAADGTPGLSFWSGETGKASITNIRRNGDDVTFNVIGFSDTEIPPGVTSIMTEAFMDAAIIRFSSDRDFDGEAVVTWGRTDMDKDTLRVMPYDTGCYSVTLEGLEPGNKTYTAGIYFEISGVTGEESKTSFMTKKKPAVSWPFIYMTGVGKNSDGTLPAGSRLPLRVSNASDAAEIRWEFNGNAAVPEGDGYFTVTRSGELKAFVTWEDGTQETIMKEIIIGTE